MTAIALSPATDNVTRPITSPFSKYLQELLEDGIYLLFLLRNSNAPNSLAEFNKRIEYSSTSFRTNAPQPRRPPAAVSDAKYAFCALMDEIILSSEFAIREDLGTKHRYNCGCLASTWPANASSTNWTICASTQWPTWKSWRCFTPPCCFWDFRANTCLKAAKN